MITRIWYGIRINRCSCLPEISRVAGAPDSHLVQRIRAEKQHLLAAQMHNHVKSHWSMHRHMARLSVVCRGALIWHVGPVFFPPRVFRPPFPWPKRMYPSVKWSLVGGKKKKKKREKRKERQRSTKDAQNCSYFCFLWKKKSQGFSVLLCTGLSWKQTKVKSVIFPQRKQRGSYIFPADPRMNHHSQAAVGDIAAQFSAQIYI